MERLRNKTRLRRGIGFLLPVYVLCMLVMISDYKIVSNFVGSITTLIALCIIFFEKKYNFTRIERRSVLCISFFLLFYTVTSLFQFDAHSWFTGVMVYMMVFTPFLVLLHLQHTENVESINYLVFCFIIIWNIFLSLCFTTCIAYPGLARAMASQRTLFVDVINGGGYPMGYGSAILATYLFSKLLHGEIKGKLTMILVIAEILFMSMTIFVINSFIIIFSLITGVLLVAVSKVAKSRKSAIFSYSMTGIILLVIGLNISEILKYLKDNTEDELLQKRWEEIYYSVEEDENSNHVDAREYVYQKSIDGFWDSPIIGNGYKTGNVYSNNKDEDSGIGNHSSVLDALAQFGLIGGIPLLLFLLYPMKYAKTRKLDMLYLVPFYIMLCLNPTIRCYHVMLIVYLIIPSMENLLKEKKNR